MRILVAGCGYVGTELSVRLLQRGHEVWGLRRHAHVLPAKVTAIVADLSDPQTLGTVPESLDAVVYCAAPDERSEAAYRSTYVDGLKNLLHHSALERVQRVVFTSSTAVYGQSDGQWIDEDSPTEPETFSGKCLLEAERVVAELGRAGVVLRLAGIYGPGRDRLLRSIQTATVRLQPEPPSYTNRIHRDDCAGAIAHLLHLPNPERVYIGVDDAPTPRNEVVRWLADRLDVPLPVPSELPREISRLGAPAELQSGGNKRCSNRRLRSSGYDFLYPSYREGYAAMLATHS